MFLLQWVVIKVYIHFELIKLVLSVGNTVHLVITLTSRSILCTLSDYSSFISKFNCQIQYFSLREVYFELFRSNRKALSESLSPRVCGRKMNSSPFKPIYSSGMQFQALEDFCALVLKSIWGNEMTSILSLGKWILFELEFDVAPGRDQPLPHLRINK